MLMLVTTQQLCWFNTNKFTVLFLLNIMRLIPQVLKAHMPPIYLWFLIPNFLSHHQLS